LDHLPKDLANEFISEEKLVGTYDGPSNHNEITDDSFDDIEVKT